MAIDKTRANDKPCSQIGLKFYFIQLNVNFYAMIKPSFPNLQGLFAGDSHLCSHHHNPCLDFHVVPETFKRYFDTLVWYL